MNILCIGDVVGKPGRDVLEKVLPRLRQEFSVDCVIVNAENAAGGSGLTPKIAKEFFQMGCDLLTLGDHVWDRPELVDFLKEEPRVIRPANFPPGGPGSGWAVVETSGGKKVGVVNLLGRVFVKYYPDCPFRAMAPILAEIKKQTHVVVVDFHAEATSEKVALGWFLDGQVSALVGTHTHIQTADERVLPKGTAYLTDLGMTGPYDSVIGQDKEKIINRFVTGIPVRFEVANDNPVVCGAVINVDERTGAAQGIIRIQRGA
ncbi:MAG TPA: TIGR00282 family metallophosphoesterase [Candidatus Bathyarchaeia archaeon]|nr:TIGR00282 family metallophosphoesterase [Candidatus Bathyarchaeia archaeon]